MTVDRDRRSDLTGAQSGVWYAQQVDPGNPVYNVGQYVDLRGDLDVGRFQEAVAAVAAEADALRTRIVDEGGVPRQAVHAPGGGEGRVDLVDLRGRPDPEAAALEAMLADMDTPADLFGGELYRFTLYRVGDGRHLWYQRFHHILVDAYSVAAITRRTAAHYTALGGGREAGRGFRPLREVVAEEEAYDASDRREDDRAYWARAMEGRPEPALLSQAAPAAPRRAVRARSGIGAEGRARVEEAAAAAGAGWAEALTALVACYVHRRTGARDVVLGMPVMNRLGSAALRTPSMVVNVLPLRVAVAPGDTVGAVIGRTKEALAGLRAHQRYRAEDVRRDLNLVGRAAGLYGPMVNIKAFDYALPFQGLEASVRTLSEGPVDDVSLSVHTAADGGLGFELNANPARYTEDDARERLAEFTRLVEGALSAPDAAAPEAMAPDPAADGATTGGSGDSAPAGPCSAHAGNGTPAEQGPVAVSADTGAGTGADTAAGRAVAALRVGALDLVAPDAIGRLTAVPDPRPVPEGTVADRVAAAVAHHPDRVAVEAGDGTLTYAGLWARSGEIAAALRSHGAGAGSVVAVVLPRSSDLVAALLGAVRAGATHLPVDPEFPADRIAYMLSDSGARLAVTAPGADKAVPEDIERLVVDGMEEGPTGAPIQVGGGKDGPRRDQGAMSREASADAVPDVRDVHADAADTDDERDAGDAPGVRGSGVGLRGSGASGTASVALDGPVGTGSLTGATTAPCSAAYVLYTSGSTGRPKGVVV
ncbi:condensation domain-containing protein, partial [Nocardiopsis suaedae]